MRQILVVLLVCVFLSGCDSDSSPAEIFSDYSTELATTVNLDQIDFSKYLTHLAYERFSARMEANYSAQMIRFPGSRTVNGKPSMMQPITMTVNSETKVSNAAKLLHLLKSDAVTTDKSLETVDEERGTAELQSVVQNHPTPNTVFTRTVYFKNEDGWKIERITVHTEKEGTKERFTTF